MNKERILINIGKTVALVFIGIGGVFVSVLINSDIDIKDMIIVKNKNILNDMVEGINSKVNLVLVNKNNKLDKKFKPESLVVPNISFSGNNSLVSSEIAVNLEAMFKDALSDGINLIGVSGYRSYEYQEKLYSLATSGTSSYNADYVAMPGYSEHQTGLAIDILSEDYLTLDDGFKNTNAYKWLVNNAHRYGFIIRYPEYKEDVTGYPFEPWHFRYVGIDVASNIYRNGITLEEYLN